MAILIKNPEVEQRARELAAVTGETLTAAIDTAVKMRLEQENAKAKRRPTLEEAMAATRRFRAATGLDKRKVSASKADFDDLWAEGDTLDRK
jgi:antitoxin VapB